MATINGVGRLGKNPVMKYTPKGMAQTNFSVAVNSGYGENKETNWVSMVCWGQMAETANKFLVKGSQIEFVAELQRVRTYDKAGGDVGVNIDGKLLLMNFISDIAKSDETPFDSTPEPEEF